MKDKDSRRRIAMRKGRTLKYTQGGRVDKRQIEGLKE